MKKNIYNLILEPVLTEKSNEIREPKKKSTKKHYVFKVRQDANKTEIVKAISKLYNVNPIACNIINVKPKKKNRRMSASGYTRKYKKAIITLVNEEQLNIFNY